MNLFAQPCAYMSLINGSIYTNFATYRSKSLLNLKRRVRELSSVYVLSFGRRKNKVELCWCLCLYHVCCTILLIRIRIMMIDR